MRAKHGGQFSSAAVLTAALGFGMACAAQKPSQDQPPQKSQERPVISEDRIGKAEDQGAKSADGKRHGLPLETYGVAPGTKFLVALEDDLGTKSTPEKTKFKVKT